MSHLHDWTGMSTEERDILLEAFCKQGLTSSKIALQFVNCSRNAVVGRVHRLQAQGKKIRLGGYQSNSPRSKKRKPVDTQAEAAKPDLLVIENPKLAKKSREYDHSLDALPLIVTVEPKVGSLSADVASFIDQALSPTLTADQRRDMSFQPLPGVAFISQLDLSSNTCRWPVNGTFGREPIHCGAPCIPHTYCEAHRRLAYTPRSPTLKEVRRGANS